MADVRSFRVAGEGEHEEFVVHTVFSDRADGDLAVRPDVCSELELRRARLAPPPWTWLHQVHGASVVEVTRPGDRAGEFADAAVTNAAATTLSVQVADCAALLAFSACDDGVVVAAAHAGWKGLLAGVVEATVDGMRHLGGGEISWLLGPCISSAAYEFSPRDLDRVAARLGDGVRAVTAVGRPALDMTAAVRAAMTGAGVEAEPLGIPSVCTVASDRHWSHRGAGDTERQVGAIWWERAAAPASPNRRIGRREGDRRGP